MQEEEQNNDDSFVLIEKAKEHQEHGESIALSDAKDPIKCKPFLDSLILALVKRESTLGRYAYETAQTYASIGNLYFHMRHPRAAVMFRASFRIEYFLYGKCSGRIAGDFKGFLLERGLSDNDTEDIRKDILFSARYEVEGDILRRFGDRRAAAMEYQKAARREELAFGTDNPDLAFLWRKMACLASIKKENMHIIDFDECDRLGSKWINEVQGQISSSVSAGIAKGDKYYQSLLYGKAIKEYVKATLGDKPRPIPKPKPRRNNRRTSTGGASVHQELQAMIASSSNSSVQSRPRQPQQSGHPGNAKSQNLRQNAIKVSANAVPFPIVTQSLGAAASQDSSLHSRSIRNLQQQSVDSGSIIPPQNNKRMSISSKDSLDEFDESELALKDHEEKSQDFDTVAIASSVGTSDDESWYSHPQNFEQGDSTKKASTQSYVENNQRPFLATSLYEMVSKNSSRVLGAETGSSSKKPKSESALRYMSIKPATKFANRAMKKLRGKKGTSTPEPTGRNTAPEGSNYTSGNLPAPTTMAADPAVGNPDNIREINSMNNSVTNMGHPPNKPLHPNTGTGMPAITEMSSPESLPSRTYNNELPSASMRSLSESRRGVRSRRAVPVRRFSSDSEEMIMIEKPRSSSSSRRHGAMERAKKAARQKQQQQPRQRAFKKVIPANNNNQRDEEKKVIHYHQRRDAEALAKVGGSDNPFLVFEDPSNSSSSPSPPTALNKRR